MLNTIKKKRSEKGFTIIEVMIVLAIAALILLIVFLAVPALQRSSRNTSRKNDAANALTSIGNYVSNNNGSLPNSTASLVTAVQDAKFGYYTPSPATAAGPVFYGTATALPTAQTTAGAGTASASVLNTEDIIFVAGATCNGNTPTATGASARSYVVLYEVETGSSGATEQCISS